MPSIPRISPDIEKPVTWSRPFSNRVRDLKNPLRTAYRETKWSPVRYRLAPRRTRSRLNIVWSAASFSERVRSQHGWHNSRRLQVEQVVLNGTMSSEVGTPAELASERRSARPIRAGVFVVKDALQSGVIAFRSGSRQRTSLARTRFEPRPGMPRRWRTAATAQSWLHARHTHGAWPPLERVSWANERRAGKILRRVGYLVGLSCSRTPDLANEALPPNEEGGVRSAILYNQERYAGLLRDLPVY